MTGGAFLLIYHLQVILSGRRINDGMRIYIAQQAIKKMIQNNHNVNGLKALVLGITFKENVSDLRNSRVPEMITELKSFGVDVEIHDPLADADEARHEYDLEIKRDFNGGKYALILIAIAHDDYRKLGGSRLREMVTENAVIVDIKHLFEPGTFGDNGVLHWRI